MANIKIGNDTLTGVNIVKVQDADTSGQYDSFIMPSGNINITSTTSTNVADYATAQVVDAALTAANIKKDVAILGVTGSLEEAVPIDIATDAGMTAVLISANVGKSYRFTGTTGTYTNGDIYIVEDTEASA